MQSDPKQLLHSGRAAITAPQPIAATVRMHSIPRHAYAVTVYMDNSGSLKEESLPNHSQRFSLKAYQQES